MTDLIALSQYQLLQYILMNVFVSESTKGGMSPEQPGPDDGVIARGGLGPPMMPLVLFLFFILSRNL